MKVYCPVHKKGFSVPRRNPIRCESGEHILAELNFEGRVKEVVEACWEYCCNCEHFWPTESAHRECPVCNRQISRRYLCSRCFTFTLESSTAVAIKNFTLTTEGVPQPACPGCLQEPPAEISLAEHECDALGAIFITAFRSCPVCGESIGDVVSFPVLNADYLRRMKRRPTLMVDYENDALIEAEKGEFVLVTHSNGVAQAIVLPELVKFARKEDFYENYQDYYHCVRPSAGQIVIIQPAAVERIEGGWRLKEAGILEIHQEQPTHFPETSGLGVPIIDEGANLAPLADKQQEESFQKCWSCGAFIEPEHLLDWGYCWHCGERLKSKGASAVELMSEDTLVPSPAKRVSSHPPTHSASRLSILEPPPEDRQVSSVNVNSRKLPLLLRVALVVLGIVFGLVIRSWLWTGTVDVNNVQEQSGSAASPATAPSPVQTHVNSSADIEISNIVERLESAQPSDHAEIVKELQSAEQKYPNDYRFPYERAKHSIKGGPAHDEAFSALLVAAKRAMSTGKAQEMLSELMADKDTYFQKPSRGHGEWSLLIGALKDEDKEKLKGLSASLEKRRGH